MSTFSREETLKILGGGSVEQVQKLIAANEIDPEMSFSITYAAKCGNVEVVKFFVKEKGNIYTKEARAIANWSAKGGPAVKYLDSLNKVH